MMTVTFPIVKNVNTINIACSDNPRKGLSKESLSFLPPQFPTRRQCAGKKVKLARRRRDAYNAAKNSKRAQRFQ